MKTRPEASPIADLVGGKYRIVRLIARGGMGVVYEAQHTVVRRRFAIKFLRRDLAERRDILARFQREAETAGALENENVTASVDFGISDDGTPYIVMEYLVGESVAALLAREGRLPVHRAADLVAQACRGVEAAHAAGIVHRDLKPQNLFVSRREDGTDLLKVLDFGVAKLQAIDDATAATGTGILLGTAAYMSPEQARGEKMVDRRADVYALGAILYELVSRRKPHPGDSQNAILHHIATHPAVPLDSVQRDLPAELVEAVGRALASDPAARPPSAGALAQELAPFARREVWPPTPEDTGPTRAELTSTFLSPVNGERGPPSPDGPAGVAADQRGPPPSAPGRRRSRTPVAIGAIAIAALVIAVAVGSRQKGAAPGRPAERPIRTLASATRFYVPPPNPGAVQQIARLAEAHAFREAALITAMEAVPHALYFTGGSPDEVEAAVRKVLLRAGHDGGIPVLVAYNLPYRDCAQYSAGGSRDGTAYRAWIEGFARGIGGQTAIVILEPDSLGIVPYGTMLYGGADWCKPTVTDAQGKAVPAPGATADEHYALIASAVDRLARSAPNALVYLDGTNSVWLWVPEIAHRLARVGVDRTQGFAVNLANSQPTSESVKYGTWISKCLAYASRHGNKPAAFLACPSGHRRPADSSSPIDDWESPEAWYRDNVDNVPQASPAESRRAHFIVDTSRNGRGPLEVAIYAGAPFDQPPEIIAKLRATDWCNPPSAGSGARPTARTGVPLVDAFLWIKSPGDSDGSCDEAGGARAWDYARFNPWGVAGDTQRHFDPLWGMVDPEAGEWFPEAALQLARYAHPPLEEHVPVRLAEGSGAGERSAAAAGPLGGMPVAPGGGPGKPPALEGAGRPGGHPESVGRPGGHPARRLAGVAPTGSAPAAPANAPIRAEERRPLPPTFDPENPYR